MATTSTDLTVGDILAKFGSIPLRRIRQDPEPGKATEQDVEEIHDRENRLYELVDGILVEKTMGLFESRVAIVLAHLLQTFLDQKDLGIVLGSDGTMRLAPGLVRIPDVAFVSRERLGSGLPRQPIPDLAPDLAVEVLSPSNSDKEMQRKLREYFAAGVRLVWYIDPRKRTASVYVTPDNVTVLNDNSTLDGGDLLPGFTLSLKELFDRAER
jgi:Uma2 family endonuclease